MKYTPHDYQTRATNFILEHPKAGMLLEMGLGKTVITMTALAMIRQPNKTITVYTMIVLHVISSLIAISTFYIISQVVLYFLPRSALLV